MDITEIQDELLRLEYPNLLPDHDPDIERYYYLRSTGQARDAMSIYQNRLRIRYPDDDFRTWLLRSYRSHDPAFRGLLARGYRMLGARSLERIKGIILVIAEKAGSYNEKDVYATIKTAEDILHFLPPDRYEAVAGMERFLRYAGALDLRVKAIAKATELIRAYLTDTLSVVEEERRRRTEAQRRMKDEELQRLVKADWDSYYYQKKYGVHMPLIDLSSVVFSAGDLARIEIPPFNRIEDQILGYCIKYWNAVEDPAFERILFLYSRKYGKKNYDVYMTIRRGRQAKHRDDEILASIMGVLVTGYYYSIQGDLYLQRSWNSIKYALANQPKALPAPAKAPARQIEVKQAGTKQASAKPAGAKQAGAKSAEAKQAKQAGTKPAAAKPRRTAAKPVTVKPAATVKPAMAKPATVKPAAAKSAAPAKAAPPPRPAPKIAPKPKSKAAPKIAPRPPVKTPARPAAVAARPVRPGTGAGKTPSVPARPVKVPYRLKPAPETQTTIVARPSPPVPARPAAKPAPAPAAAKPAVTRPAAPPPRPLASAPPRPLASAPPRPAAEGYRPAPFVPASPPKKRPKQRVFTNRTLGKAKGSVSDRLKELSGRSYDVYEDRFLAKTRASIRKILGTGRGLFFNLPEEAEDLVYNFLRDHYSDPYMDWEDSADRRNLLALGFDLPSLYPVIDECYRTL